MTEYWFNTEKTTIHILGEGGRYLCGMECMPKHSRADASWVADNTIFTGVINEEIEASVCERCKKRKLALIEGAATR